MLRPHSEVSLNENKNEFEDGELTGKLESPVKEEHHNPNQRDSDCSSNQYTCELDDRQ